MSRLEYDSDEDDKRLLAKAAAMVPAAEGVKDDETDLEMWARFNFITDSAVVLCTMLHLARYCLHLASTTTPANEKELLEKLKLARDYKVTEQLIIRLVRIYEALVDAVVDHTKHDYIALLQVLRYMFRPTSWAPKKIKLTRIEVSMLQKVATLFKDGRFTRLLKPAEDYFNNGPDHDMFDVGFRKLEFEVLDKISSGREPSLQKRHFFSFAHDVDRALRVSKLPVEDEALVGDLKRADVAAYMLFFSICAWDADEDNPALSRFLDQYLMTTYYRLDDEYVDYVYSTKDDFKLGLALLKMYVVDHIDDLAPNFSKAAGMKFEECFQGTTEAFCRGFDDILVFDVDTVRATDGGLMHKLVQGGLTT